ncbi:MAG: hypothetical protein ACYTAF_14540 [Planctomycetota bacterium]|jgi:hypothetical protein
MAKQERLPMPSTRHALSAMFLCVLVCAAAACDGDSTETRTIEDKPRESVRKSFYVRGDLAPEVRDGSYGLTEKLRNDMGEAGLST